MPLQQLNSLRAPGPCRVAANLVAVQVAGIAPTRKVMEVLTGHPGERLPVLDDTGRLLGYLTKTDLVLMFRGMAGEG